MLGVTVKGGTGAGRKRPLKPAPRSAWECDCGKRHPKHLTRCSVCRKERPDAQ